MVSSIAIVRLNTPTAVIILGTYQAGATSLYTIMTRLIAMHQFIPT